MGGVHNTESDAGRPNSNQRELRDGEANANFPDVSNIEKKEQSVEKSQVEKNIKDLEEA